MDNDFKKRFLFNRITIVDLMEANPEMKQEGLL